MKRTYINNTDKYQLVGNSKDVIASGTYEECNKAVNELNIEESIWCVAQILQPGESCSFTPHVWPERYLEQVRFDSTENMLEELLNLQ